MWTESWQCTSAPVRCNQHQTTELGKRGYRVWQTRLDEERLQGATNSSGWREATGCDKLVWIKVKLTSLVRNRNSMAAHEMKYRWQKWWTISQRSSKWWLIFDMVVNRHTRDVEEFLTSKNFENWSPIGKVAGCHSARHEQRPKRPVN